MESEVRVLSGTFIFYNTKIFKLLILTIFVSKMPIKLRIGVDADNGDSIVQDKKEVISPMERIVEAASTFARENRDTVIILAGNKDEIIKASNYNLPSNTSIFPSSVQDKEDEY